MPMASVTFSRILSSNDAVTTSAQALIQAHAIVVVLKPRKRLIDQLLALRNVTLIHSCIAADAQIGDRGVRTPSRQDCYCDDADH